MGEGEKNLTARGDVGTEPLFTEESEEEARPVVPLELVGAKGPSAGAARRRLPRSLLLALVLIAGGAAGVVVGYLVFTRGAAEPAQEATVVAAPEPVSSQPAPSNNSSASTGATVDSLVGVEPRARDEIERPNPNAAGGLDQDEEGRAERALKEEERRRDDEEESAEREREEAEERAERRREREKEKRGKPKARLIDVIPYKPGP